MNSDMEERLLAYFHGEADETERKEVERWLVEVPENREAYRRLVRDCLFVRWAGREQRIDAVERKSRLLRLMRRRRTRRMWPRVAAAVAVLVVAGGTWWLSDFGRKERPLARAERPIVPGSQKAVLVLSTGERVDLVKSEGDIREQDGSLLQLSGERKIVYDTTRPVEGEKLIYNKIVVPRGGEFFLTLADDEIDGERGVITEEWRTRRTPDFRIRNQIMPVLLKDSKYAERDVIGDLEIIQNFKYQTLRDYYHKWYGPDLQAIAVVGDFDVDEMEKKIKEVFSSIPPRKGGAVRESFSVPEHSEILYVLATDPEVTSSSVSVYIKFPATPKEQKNHEYARSTTAC